MSDDIELKDEDEIAEDGEEEKLDLSDEPEQYGEEEDSEETYMSAIMNPYEEYNY